MLHHSVSIAAACRVAAAIQKSKNLPEVHGVGKPRQGFILGFGSTAMDQIPPAMERLPL